MHVVIIKVKEGYAYDKFEYEESYAGYDIRKVTDNNLTEPVKALLPAVNFAHLLFKDDYVFLSENTDEIKQVIDAIEAEETWEIGKFSAIFQYVFARGKCFCLL